MTALWNFILALPALFKLLQTLQKRIDAAGVDRKVRDDVKAIHEAFDAENSDQLNRIFNS